MKDLSVFHTQTSPTHRIDHPLFREHDIALYIKRDDLLHPLISGNKWRKLKYNLLAMQEKGWKGIVTFGGAFSNHLHAVAAAAHEFGFGAVGIVRGEEPANPSPTLVSCASLGMKLFYVSREAYTFKESAPAVKEILENFPQWAVLPEGGANELGMKGCTEVIDEIDVDFDFLCTACGTGTTWAGLAGSAKPEHTIVGISVLKGAEKSLWQMVERTSPLGHYKLISDYHFGGYAKHTPQLFEFIKDFESAYAVPLEQVYTGKLLFGMIDLAKKGFFRPGSKVVALHTGGLQGRHPSLGSFYKED